jgi:hypothetical protein
MLVAQLLAHRPQNIRPGSHRSMPCCGTGFGTRHVLVLCMSFHAMCPEQGMQLRRTLMRDCRIVRCLRLLARSVRLLLFAFLSSALVVGSPSSCTWWIDAVAELSAYHWPRTCAALSGQ